MNRAQADKLKEYIDARIDASHSPKDVKYNQETHTYKVIGGDEHKLAHDYAEMVWSHFYRLLPKDEDLTDV